MQEDKTKDSSLLKLLEIYTKQPLFLVQRVDRPVSGVVVLAKTKEAAADFQNQMDIGIFQKTYLAIVPKKEISVSGRLEHWLGKSAKDNKAFIVDASFPDAKKATLEYEIVSSLENYMCLSIRTLSGRFHQIRAQLAAIGLPIKGDVKYGSRRGNKDRSILLHAHTIEFNHPKTGIQMAYKVDPPETDIWPHFTKST